MDLKNSLYIAAAGMRAEGTRLKVIAENLANVDSVSQTPGGEPYRRKLVSFKSVLDRDLGADLVKVDKVRPDQSDFELRYDPTHPAANADGYVLEPNVNPMVELADMREAERTYDANLNIIESSRTMLQRTIDILKV